MEIDIPTINKFKQAIKADYGLDLNGDEAKETLVRLVNFFDLLSRWDAEDKQKAKEMEVKQNGERTKKLRFI